MLSLFGKSRRAKRNAKRESRKWNLKQGRPREYNHGTWINNF